MSRAPGAPGAWVALPAGLALALHAPALGSGFLHDDTSQILANPALRDLSRLPALWASDVWAGVGTTSSWYRPLMTSSFALEHALFGFEPRLMHATSLLLFAATVALLGRLVARAQASVAVGIAAALLLAVHPLVVEPTFWISARCELLAAGLGVAALSLHRRAGVSVRPWPARLGSGACLALALFAKESAVAFVPALLALDRVAGASLRPTAVLARLGPAAVGAAAYAALRRAALPEAAGALAALPDPVATLAVFGQGLARLVWPAALSIEPAAPLAAHGWLGAAGLAAGAWGGLRTWRSRSPLAVPLALGLAALGVASVAATRVEGLADRYLLVPLIAAAWLGAAGLGRLAGRSGWPAAGGVAFGASLALGAASLAQGRVFASELALWTRAAAVRPDLARPALNLGVALLERGEPRAALASIERALELAPGDPRTRRSRAAALAASRREDEARSVLEALLNENPSDAAASLALGHLDLEAGRLEAARVRYEAVTRLRPQEAEAWAGLGVIHARTGRARAAREALERALRLDPQVQHAAELERLVDSLAGS